VTVLGVDIGTTGMKLGLYRATAGGLDLAGHFSQGYDINTYNNGQFSDVEPEKWQAAFVAGCRELGPLVADVEAYSTRSGTERLIGFLLRDCLAAGEDGEPVPEGSLDIELPVAKGIIASRLNLTQEHLSRILHDLSSLGLIEVHGRRIHVRDVDRLRRHAR
jgi:hypothetical protein